MKERWSLAEKINSYFIESEAKKLSKLAYSLMISENLDNKLRLDNSWEVSYLTTSIAWNISRKKPDKNSISNYLESEKKKIIEESPKIKPLTNIIDRAANLITWAYTKADKKTPQKEIFDQLEPDMTRFRDEIIQIKYRQTT